MIKLSGILVFAISFGAFSLIYAHPGGPLKHKFIDIFHYLTDPFHIIMFLLTTVCIAYLFLGLRGRSDLKRTQKVTCTYRSNS